VRPKRPGSYNQPLLPKTLTSAGKASIAVAGFFWGICQGVREPESTPSAPARVRLNEMEERIGRLELLIARLPKASGAKREADCHQSGIRVSAPIEKRGSNTMREERSGENAVLDGARPIPEILSEFVTRQELTEALALAEKRLQRNLRDQMDTHMLAIGSLRTMIANTDSLLERVLHRLEASMAESAE
jgi:hypothetical protein